MLSSPPQPGRGGRFGGSIIVMSGQSRPAYLIAPSILSADFSRLGDEVEAVLAAGADIIHFDVMDNHYVPNLTVGPLVCAALRRRGITAPIDVHLMVEPVDELARAFAGAGASWISFHPEATRHVDRTIALVRELGCRPGLALNPATPLTPLDHTLESLDFVLVMSVNPGFGGQQYIEGSTGKVARLREMSRAAELAPWVSVDGGVKAHNAAPIVAAGADVLVSGSGIFNARQSPAEAVEAFRAALRGG